MSFDRYMLEKISGLPLLEVAGKLGLKYKGIGPWRKTACFLHDDSSPSLGLNHVTGRWCCFGCGAKGDVIGLVMQHEQLDFEQACLWLCKEFSISPASPEKKFNLSQFIKQNCMNLTHSQYLDPKLMKRFAGRDNSFTRAMTQTGFLTAEQMARAAGRFRLSSIGDAVVFWMIDAEGNLHDGKVMAYTPDGHRSKQANPYPVSWLLRREKLLPESWRPQWCLFGLHQLSPSSTTPAGGQINEQTVVAGGQSNEQTVSAGGQSKEQTVSAGGQTVTASAEEEKQRPVAVVESEKTAILCSELLADEGFLWMATGGYSNLSVQLLSPLKGHRIILFPDTDVDGETFRGWEQTAAQAQKTFGHPVTVSDLLERYASPEERKRKIDLADFLLDHRSD